MRGSGSLRAMLAVAGTAIMMGAGMAATAPAAVAAAGQRAFGFGSNIAGNLGDGTTNPLFTAVGPVPVGLPAGTVQQVAAGGFTSGALMSDGTVWTWGDNTAGTLGNGSAGGFASTPQQVPGLTGVVQIAISDEDSGYAVGSDGTVWAWGSNYLGQLGTGSTADSYSPVRVPGLTGITQVAAGGGYVLALRVDGTVWAWGDNGGGELGDGTTTSHLTPEQVPGLTWITQVAAGGGASFAVRVDGALFGWGDNTHGELGNGTSGGFTVTPAQVPGLTGVTQAATFGGSTLAIASPGGTVWAWGANDCGQLGDGTEGTSRSTPEALALSGVSQVALGDRFLSEGYSGAVRAGTLYTWGCNDSGQLGTGTASGPVLTPTPVTTVINVRQIAFGGGICGSQYGCGILFNAGYGLAIGSPPGISVPNLGGDTTTQASQALQAAGLVLGTVSTVVDSTCNNIGTVMNQNPAAGSTVSSGSAVSVTIGKRPPPPRQCP